ncbi:hypothetical protein [Limisphaera sp. VF-2]|jgi:hypothetical protein|uniref:hypothetical protein n=1 Tax=Limisphaera sp. VF-2 TaxID=3400418 RepID=UPI0017703EF5|nr:hypothetical protein [Limisphaera sp.]
MMKRKWRARNWAAVWVLWLGMLVPPAQAADELFLNSGVLRAVFPPEPLPVIDARRVVNLGILALTNALLPGPIEFQNVLFITNRGQWWGSPGYRLETIDPQGNPQRRMAAVFHNEGLLHPNAAEVSTDLWLLVQATNIINRGRLEIGPFGQINLTGHNLDLRGGELRYVESGDTNFALRTYDIYWGFNTNALNPFTTFSWAFAPPLISDPHWVTTLQDIFYQSMLTQVTLPAGFDTHVQISDAGNNNFLIQAVYVYNASLEIQTEVRMIPNLRVVRWSGLVTNPVTRFIQTNEVYLTEFLTPENYNYNLTNGSLYIASVNPAGAFRPFNFVVSSVPPPFYNAMPVVAPSGYDPTLLTMGTNATPESTNSGYFTKLIPAVMLPSSSQIGSGFSNVLGRMELVAGSALDLREARLNVPSYLRLDGTNHFVGSTNAQIEAPFSDIRLSSTNGLLEIRHLQLPRVPRMVGDLRAWVGMWTNITATGEGLWYRVLMISNYFEPSAEPMIQDLELRSPRSPYEVRVADKLNVLRSALIDAERVTLTTNLPPGRELPPWLLAPFHPRGELNFLSNTIAWAESFPRLRYLTNEGNITVSNAASLLGLRRPPWSPSVFQEPYEAVINKGSVDAHGLEIWSRFVQNEGALLSWFGPLRIRAGEMRLGSPETNLLGRIEAPLANVELGADGIQVTNHTIQAGRRLVLGGTNYLGDADTTNNVFTARDGLTLTVRPAAGDLRGTTITNFAPAYAYNVTVWAGEDRGATPEGFTNNAAIGRLLLDGQFGSVFRFQGLGVSNALYVDQLILLNYATNELNNAFVALDIAPNLVVYYADLWVGNRRLAEPVDSSRYNQGRLRWVRDYAGGFYGSTNLVIGSLEIRINAALRESTELDSDGDGIPNALDPVPVLVPEAVTPADVPLTAQWQTGATPFVILTWPSLPGAVNTVYESASLTAPNWQVVLKTNFATLPLPADVPCWDPACWTNVLPGRAAVRVPVGPQGQRYYRVQVELPRR